MEKSDKNQLSQDGLSSLSYTKLNSEELPLYTWFVVQIPPGPKKREVNIIKNIGNELWSGVSLLGDIFHASSAMMRAKPRSKVFKTKDNVNQIY